MVVVVVVVLTVVVIIVIGVSVVILGQCHRGNPYSSNRGFHQTKEPIVKVIDQPRKLTTRNTFFE